MQENKKRRLLVFSVDALVCEDLEYLATCPNFQKYLGGARKKDEIYLPQRYISRARLYDDRLLPRKNGRGEQLFLLA